MYLMIEVPIGAIFALLSSEVTSSSYHIESLEEQCTVNM